MIRLERQDMDCAGCPLARQRWRVAGRDHAVFGLALGDLSSRIVIVAEAPGDTEVHHRKPLCGPTSRWFAAVMDDAKIPIETTYLTNALLCQPTGKDSELKGYEREAINHCRPSLVWEIEALTRDYGVRVVVAMGATALKALLPDCAYSLEKARGYVFSGPGGVSVIPTWHPSPKNLLAKTGSAWVLMVNDLKKAKRIADGELPPPVARRILFPTLSQVVDWFKQPRPVAVDVENTQDGRLVMIGFCDGVSTIVVPYLQQGGASYWPFEEEGHVRSIVGAALNSPGWVKAFHNGAHDVTILAGNGFRVEGWKIDTMLGWHACYPDQLKSLHHLGSVYRLGPPWKPPRRVESAEAEETK